MELPESAYDMVRVGISVYGLYPSADVNRQRIQLRPVLSLKTAIVHAKTVTAGEAISYGMHYYTSAEECIATIPVGYADGYSRMLSGKAHMLIRGRRVPVLGRICMDQCMVSLEPLGHDGPLLEPGEEVVLLGEQGEERITAEEIAEQLGTIHYEVVCMVAHRVPRLYIESGSPSKSLTRCCKRGIRRSCNKLTKFREWHLLPEIILHFRQDFHVEERISIRDCL